MDYSWLIVVLSLLLCAFFSGIEIAFFESNKLRIELENKQGNFSSHIISSYFFSQSSRFIGAMLLGNIISITIYTIFSIHVFNNALPGFSTNTRFFISIFLSSVLMLFTAEILSKSIFRINPNGILKFFVIPALLFYFIFYPFISIILNLADFILKKIFRADFSVASLDFTRLDLNNLIKEASEQQASGKNEKEIDHEIQIFQNALDFSSIRIRECMIPRTEIVAKDINDNINELREEFVNTGLSKILIYKETIDNIVGYVHSFELFKKPERISSIVMPVLVVPETMAAQEALSRFIQERKSMAVVVDEFGGTSGLLTIEDVIEEIFGDIEDEHDKEEFEKTRLSNSEFIFSGRLEVDYLNEEYELNLPVGEEYETLAGLIIAHHGSIPSLGEVITVDGFRFKITGVTDKRIEKVQLKIIQE